MLRNLRFGWIWIVLGMVSGTLMGLGFLDAQWLGGYTSLDRRMLRLAHISFFALGTLNILFFLSRAHLGGLSPAVLRWASWCFIVGGVLMPGVCLAMLVDQRAHHLFAAPVVALLAGASATAWGGTSS